MDEEQIAEEAIAIEEQGPCHFDEDERKIIRDGVLGLARCIATKEVKDE